MAIDLYRPADRAQLQLIANTNAAPVNDRLRQGDLKLAGHFGHGPIMPAIKGIVKDGALTVTGTAGSVSGCGA